MTFAVDPKLLSRLESSPGGQGCSADLLHCRPESLCDRLPVVEQPLRRKAEGLMAFVFGFGRILRGCLTWVDHGDLA